MVLKNFDYSCSLEYKRQITLKDFKNAKNGNYYFLNPEHFKSSFTS